jgi:hypothetical protein
MGIVILITLGKIYISIFTAYDKYDIVAREISSLLQMGNLIFAARGKVGI